MKNKRLEEIVLVLILLASLVLAGLFLVGRKTASFENVKTDVVVEKKAVGIAKAVAPAEVAGSVKILFTGDMMLDRYIRQVSEKRGNDFIFAGVQELLAKNDLVVSNLEGPITDNPSVSVNSEIGARDNYIFTFDPSAADQLAKQNIKLVSLGNNHSLNFGEAGLSKTKENLKSSNVDFFGDPMGEKRLAVWEKNKVKLVFISYNQFEKDAKNKTLADLEQAKKMKATQIILYTHWGTEFIGQSDAKIKELGRGFIDSGVDLIIGSHPHVVQDKEEYKGRLIYYSLGNFIFDQYFSPETQQGLVVQVQINSQDGKISAREIPVTMKTSGQTVLN
jgi:gamma-polyglutamate biosynthesis protein CapA